MNRKLTVLLSIIVLIAGFAGGVAFERVRYSEANPVKALINKDLGRPDEVDFSLFWQAWNALHDKYVNRGELNTKDLLYGAIAGMVEKAGDPYTVFFEPKASEEFQEQISGSYGGIGIEIGERDGVLTVISPFKDTPAWEAGLKPGDKILSVDGKSTADLSVDEAVSLIRGKKGTPVVLGISSGNSEARDVRIVRDSIKVPTVEWQMVEQNGKKIAYIQLYSFNQNVDSEFRKSAREILSSDAKGLIIDLRGNPGGLLESAVYIAGWFVEEGKIVTIEDFGDGTTNEFTSNGDAALANYPTVVLVNGGSASASEILAGAMKDQLGTRLVGTKTFGKGSVQTLENFRDGSSLKITVAKWLTPKGTSISDTGIDVDIEVELPEEAIENGEVEFEFGVQGKDMQLDKALELLTK